MAKHERSAAASLERDIHFYRLDAGRDEAGRPVSLDVGSALDQIKSLPTAERYLALGVDQQLYCWVDAVSPRARIRLGNIRRSDLPQVEQGGRLGPLTIPPASGLAEQIHIVFYPNMIVGADFNFYGPRVSRLKSYFAMKAPAAPRFDVHPLLRLDVSEQLRGLRDIRMLDLKITPSFAETVAQADQSLGAAFRAAAEAGQPDVIELVLRSRARSASGLGQNVLAFVRRLGARQDVREGALRFVVKGYSTTTEAVDEIDILRDQFISRKRIVRADERSRGLSKQSAYEAIDEAYREMREDLANAAELGR